ncbi:Protein kinase family protein [Quillaja saponaria]|uniref:non-specific serine/threonine protein kinase n=1 Tax=Quillaja saponaria TaxID=32244 RepID=A0AAD7QHP8_QUISA|nr:Protein kinase family protein [Quillaja saponaria]
MKPRMEVALASLISMLWIQHIFCDELSDTSGLNKWKCSCSLYQRNINYTLANCSTSCDCSSDAGGSGSIWTCICDANGFPKVAAAGRNPNCFTACNCTLGNLSIAKDSRKHMSSKIVVVIISMCVIFTTIAFLVSVICYIYRRRECPIQLSMLSSDKESSCNSTTNLISYKSSSVAETKLTINSPITNKTGCFCRASYLFGSKTATLHGTINQFSFAELENATDNFSTPNLIGLGGSSYVYRGQLKDGRNVAVKRLKAQGGPDADIEFMTEIELLSRLHHCHLVPLLGYCSESKGKSAERVLVFEYMPNGNLRECLDGALGKNMDWATRVAIAIGAARGLEYLHEAAAPRILHRDVKSTNILLDENWRAKITDLGMAKNLRADGLPSCSNSPARMQGTFGYFAPEYAIVGRASLKSDVFSFGVVLLELLSGRQPIHKSIQRGEESLVVWATPRLQTSRQVITELPDPHLNGNFPEEEMQIMAYLAKECLQWDPDARPTMSEVVQILSAISPDKSRRNIPARLFQKSPAFLKSEPYPNHVMPLRGQHMHVEGPMDEEDQRQAPFSKWSARCSLPLDIDHNFCVGKNNKDPDIVSAECMERLILLTSNARSWRASDDETVDLTEPRFESFCMANMKSP